jgi:probable HAF family extracellular repeat protein
MKTHRNSIQSLALVATLSAGLGVISPASANSYLIDLSSKQITDLGSLEATAINDSGQFAGTFASGPNGDVHAFISGSNGAGVIDLGILPGYARAGVYGINAAGQLIGTFGIAATNQAFITGPNGVGMTDLGNSKGAL